MHSPALRKLINIKWFIPLFICIVLSTSLFNISKVSADVIAGSPYLVLTLACGDSGVIFYPSGASNPVSVGDTMTPVSNIEGPSINTRTISSLTVTSPCSTGTWSGVATSGTVTNSILTKMTSSGGSSATTTLTSTLGVSVGITQYATFSTSSPFASNYGVNRVSLPSITPAFTLSPSTETVNAATAIVGYTITSTGGAIDSYSITPTVSNSLSFSTTTGLISGTPTAQAAVVTYTITATNTAGSSTATYSLTVNADPAIAAAAEAARVAAAEAARVAAANAAAQKAKEQKELTEILAIIPKIAELTLGLGETTKSLYSTKCVKGKTTKYVKYGAKCPKGYKKK
jgi:hypothetical protein